MSQQTPSLPGAGGATATPDEVDETIQGLLALTIANDEGDSDPKIQQQRFDQAVALARAKLGRYHFTHHLHANPLEARSFDTFVRHATFILSCLRLRDGRLREDSEDLYAEIVYDPAMNDVKLWIWIWAGADLNSTKARMEEFETNMGRTIGSNAKHLRWDQVRVVWRVCHNNGQTRSRQVAWWPSEAGQHQSLSNCLRNYSAGVVSLGWFPAGPDRVGGPIKSTLSFFVQAARLAENHGKLLDVDTALGYN
ncbi:hypothetical protein F4679DRAFT_584167 [Xylaria curta]|nr:hypothetical protein F4679DRAFT_584167 [Xylaria curta]